MKCEVQRYPQLPGADGPLVTCSLLQPDYLHVPWSQTKRFPQLLISSICALQIVSPVLFLYNILRLIISSALYLCFDAQASPFFDRLVFSKIKQRLGGRVRSAISGAAPLSPHVEEFMSVALCCHFSQGYGLTETCGSSFLASGNAVMPPRNYPTLATPFPP